jgi:hypothetical protein
MQNFYMCNNRAEGITALPSRLWGGKDRRSREGSLLDLSRKDPSLLLRGLPPHKGKGTGGSIGAF